MRNAGCGWEEIFATALPLGSALLLGSTLLLGCDGDEQPNPRPSAVLPATTATTVSASLSAPPPPPSKPDAARGAYLAALSGCEACHTAIDFGTMKPDAAKAYAGGMELLTPFGKIGMPNITPHEQSGIGTWSDDQIIDGIREGKRTDATLMHYPMMPYPFYNVMSDSDAASLVLYLRSLKPIDNAVKLSSERKSTTKVVPKARGAEPDPRAVVKHGEYLANLMHCAMCHTAHDPETFAIDRAHLFAGGSKFEAPPSRGAGAFYASNLTPDNQTGVGRWTVQQLADAITNNRNRDGRTIFGPHIRYEAGWAKVKPEDALAVATYLKQLTPIDNTVPKTTFSPRYGPLTGAGPPPGGGPRPRAATQPARTPTPNGP